MCGIVGYVGSREAAPLLLDGLSRLEYRGYDSAGLAIQNGSGLMVRKVVGGVNRLVDNVRAEPAAGTSGIGHTRWATHGAPSERNAHPHLDQSGRVAVVHNGIIENATALRIALEREGRVFRTETDTEVIAHLLSWVDGPTLEDRVLAALDHLDGTYGLAVMSSLEPGKIVVARNGSPVLLGITPGSDLFVASDPSAILSHTRQVVFLEDGDLAVLTPGAYRVIDRRGRKLERTLDSLDWEVEQIQLEGFPHFMLKEIARQPQTIQDTLRGRVVPETATARLNGLNLPEAAIPSIRRIVMLGCGTSWHAGLVGRHLIEYLAGVPVQVEYASEFRYQQEFPLDDALVVAISQSGETADTLEAVRAAKAKGARVVALVNVVGSTIAREADGGIYLHAGPEISVASTKAFTSQLTALLLLGLWLGRTRLREEKRRALIEELSCLPSRVERALTTHGEVKHLADLYADASTFLYLGRGISFPVALEGALKLKEISYIHAEGYPAAEMKHGPIALIDENVPVVVVAPRDNLFQKTVSNLQEVKARGGKTIVVTNEVDPALEAVADHLLLVPKSCALTSPILSVVPLQLLAYEIALRRECNVDRPRNLAKSVTVE